jgi:segregation and condensation protein B
MNRKKTKTNQKESDNLQQKKEMSLDQKIEAILFFKSEEISLNFLTKLLGKKKKEIREALEKLEERLEKTGMTLIKNNDRYLLTTKPEFSEIIEEIKTKEVVSDLSPSALETLAIVLYRENVSRLELDNIRGVNSSYILRNLLVRGLINKKNENGSIQYIPSMDLLAFLGINNVEKMPSFEVVKKKIFELEHKNDELAEESEISKNEKESHENTN